MKPTQELLNTMRSAYEIFLTEITSHLSEFRKILEEVAQTHDRQAISHSLATRAETLQNRFHLIRGAAGFLQLGQISIIAEQEENRFKNMALGEEEILALRDAYMRAIQRLEEEAENLRIMLSENP